MKSGNINMINDVIKALHSSGHKIDQVCVWLNWACTHLPKSLSSVRVLTWSTDKFIGIGQRHKVSDLRKIGSTIIQGVFIV